MSDAALITFIAMAAFSLSSIGITFLLLATGKIETLNRGLSMLFGPEAKHA